MSFITCIPLPEEVGGGVAIKDDVSRPRQIGRDTYLAAHWKAVTFFHVGKVLFCFQAAVINEYGFAGFMAKR